jgi:D-cysteine desulfhydrase family pyridoxal phosphate-dependent enzyme
MSASRQRLTLAHGHRHSRSSPVANVGDVVSVDAMDKFATTIFASKLARFTRVGLANLPTPLEPLKRLSEYLGGPRLWVKLEDATGLGFGGNKLRKLDYVLHEALESKVDTLVSGGVVQSNSQRQVAAAAAKLGLECHLVVYRGRLDPPTPEYETSGNAFLNRVFGAKLHDSPWTGDRNRAIQELGERLREDGRSPYVVPYGVSNALGAVAYSTAVVEIAEQSRELGFEPAAIVHSSGSAGTQAGLVVGASVCLPRTRIVGIDVDAEPERVRSDVVRYAKAAADLLNVPFSETDVEVIAGHAGPAYGVPDVTAIEAIMLAGRLEAMILDPVYSGKGLAGLIALIREGRWGRDDDIVFIHTGGAPALFAYCQALDMQDQIDE